MSEKRVVMFAGKGGVGKTTCAAATALGFARCGQSTLVISTDYTPSLSDIFEVRPCEKPARVMENLYIAEFGLEEIKEMWDRKFGREVHEVFSSIVSIEYEEFVDFITSILPGLGEEFAVDYIKELNDSANYDRIVWDTAPLGQTMKLLAMPSMLRKHLKIAPRIYSRLRLGRGSNRPILKIIEEWENLSVDNIDFLQSEVDFILVTIPEALAVQQLEKVFSEFEKYSFKFRQVIINNVIRTTSSSFMRQKASQQQYYLDLIHQSYSLDIAELPLFPHEIKSLDKLEEVRKALHASS